MVFFGKFGLMSTAVSQGVRISVRTEFESGYSRVPGSHYIFTYLISIENQNEFPVQLLRRHWIIKDANLQSREVEGEGVIGQQPTIEPGQSYKYRSACNLKTEIGTMEGSYLFKRLDNGQPMHVSIPLFRMEVPYKLN